ncbi:MAG: SnoaL-like domain-containing protein, partial [Pseudomonadota bacterium]
MDAKEIGKEYFKLAQQGKDAEILEKLYSADAVSVEALAMGEMPAKAVGISAIQEKHKWWNENMEMLGGDMKGPFPNNEGTQFSVYFTMEFKNKNTGEVTKGD